MGKLSFTLLSQQDRATVQWTLHPAMAPIPFDQDSGSRDHPPAAGQLSGWPLRPGSSGDREYHIYDRLSGGCAQAGTVPAIDIYVLLHKSWCFSIKSSC